jgi:hypothetical protein
MEFTDLKYIFVGFGFTLANFALAYFGKKELKVAFEDSWTGWGIVLALWTAELINRYVT